MAARQGKSSSPNPSAKVAGALFAFLALFQGVLAPATHNWFGPLGFAIASAGMYAAASSRLYRPAVTRTADGLTCRYNLLREGPLYLLLLVLPGMAIVGIANSSELLRLGGYLLLVLMPIGLFVYVLAWRRGRLQITPTALTVPLPDQRWALADIPRERILSITAGTGRRSNGETGPITQVAYQPADSSAPATVLIGPSNSKKAVWLTVDQADLVSGLQTWKNGDPRDPALLDRVEALLRGTTAADVSQAPHDDPSAQGQGALPAANPAVPGPSAYDYDYPEPTGHFTGASVHPPTPGGYPAPGATPAEFPPGYPPPPAAQPSRWRWLRFAAIGVAALIGASITTYHSAHRASDTQPSITTAPDSADQAGCPQKGAAVLALPKKSDAEPTIFLPLAPGWTDLPNTKPADPAGTSSVRAYIANEAIRADGFTPFIQVDLTRTTATDPGSAIADDAYAKAGAIMTVSNRSVGTVCGATVYRADISDYNPDGKGPQSGASVFTVVDGTNGTRWIAAASIKTTKPDNPTYIAQRDALLAGFHAGFP